MGTKKRVLILCTGNSARSQMAEGLLRNDAGNLFDVDSAGVEPSFVRPQAIQVMNEIGIDISNHRSKSLDEFVNGAFDYVITVCDNANQRCPLFRGAAKRIHWSIEDPVLVDEGRMLSAFRNVRDELRQRLKDFADSERQSRF